MAEDAAIGLTIVICTFHREALLARALASIGAQHCPYGLDVRVLVVDNSDEGSAAETVAAAARDCPFDLAWIDAHPANISVARNRGVAAAMTPYIAFLDDDQEMAPGWLDATGAALRASDADAFFGAVEANFETPDRATPLTRQLFSRRLDAPAGAELFAMGARKTRGLALATNNSVFRRAAMAIRPHPFDADFGHGGGEDYDLLCQMQRNGSRFVWLPQARAYEFVPASRCDPAYLRQRFYAGGQAFAAAVAKASAQSGLARWTQRLRAAAQMLALAVSAPAAMARGGAARLDHSYLVAGALGKLSFGGIHPLYRRHSSAPRR
jgi:succinoglycan biosynthesis protein ExoM